MAGKCGPQMAACPLLFPLPGTLPEGALFELASQLQARKLGSVCHSSPPATITPLRDSIPKERLSLLLRYPHFFVGTLEPR